MTEMPEHHGLEAALERWRGRLRRRRALRRGWRVLWPGCALCAGLILAGALIPAPLWLPAPPGALILALVALLLVVAVAYAATARASRAEAAQVADLRLETQGLFVTAEDILRQREGGQALRQAQLVCLTQAVDRLPHVSEAQATAPGPGPRLAWGLLPLLVVAAAAWTPWAVDTDQVEERQGSQAAAEELKKIEERLKEELAAQPQGLSQEQRRRLSRLRQKLREGQVTRREAAAELGELKRELRAQSRAQADRARKPAPGAAAAARELARSQKTAGLARELGQAAQGKQGDQDKPAERDGVAEAARQLQKLDREGRRQAAAQMRQAAEAARAQGDLSLAQALEQGAQALEDQDSQALEQAAGDMQRAAQNNPQQGDPPQPQLNPEQMEQLAAELERIQQQLSGKPSGQGRAARDGDEGRVAPSPRDWQQAGPPGEPGQGGQGSSSGAGQGHSDQQAPDFDTGGHQDGDRFGDKETDAWTEVYQELHQAQLLNSDSRITTRVKGERGEGGKVLTMEGGQQAPRAEQARRALQRLPVGYSEQAREDVGTEKVPPAYRDAVRDYFDTRK